MLGIMCYCNFVLFDFFLESKVLVIVILYVYIIIIIYLFLFVFFIINVFLVICEKFFFILSFGFVLLINY